MSDEHDTNLDPAVHDVELNDDGSLYDALGLRDSGARILGVLIRLDSRLLALATRQDEILAHLDRWQSAASILSAAGGALVAGAQSRILWLLIGIALGIGALSIDAVGQAAAPLLLGGSASAP